MLSAAHLLAGLEMFSCTAGQGRTKMGQGMTLLSTDTDLLALVARHDHLWSQLTERAPKTLIATVCHLEIEIAATPAFTPEGLAGKRRVIERANFHDDEGVIAAGLRLDAKRVFANRLHERVEEKTQAACSSKSFVAANDAEWRGSHRA